MKTKLIKIHPKDNVAVAMTSLQPNEIIDLEGIAITILSPIQHKHKVALVDFNIGDAIYMYGVLVGKASATIIKGMGLTTENTIHQSEKTIQKTASIGWEAPDVSRWKDKTFMGYHRADGQVGTTNNWLFFPLVFCENRNIELLKDIFEKELLKTKTDKNQLLLRSLISGETTIEPTPISEDVFENITIKFITHPGGCGGIRQDAESLGRLLAGYVNNPNVAGVSVLSLGCQNLQIQQFKDTLHQMNPNLQKPVLIFEQQQLGTVDAMMHQIITQSFAEIKNANLQKREPAALSNLTIGLECGGSDGFSGISANPTLGMVSDYLVALGGTAILAEFPELCGVEQEIVNRCVNEEHGSKFLELMMDYEISAINVGSGFDMNPSPGNIKDGLITDAMKSAGAAKKGGTSPITDVLDYGEYIKNKGLNLLCTPGNDVESTTAIVGTGSNIVLFTTGLGTPTGNPITPVIKVSSNSDLAQKMPDIIDFNTGEIITGEKNIPEMATDLLDFIIEVASGRIETKAMLLNQNDFIPWKRGVSL